MIVYHIRAAAGRLEIGGRARGRSGAPVHIVYQIHRMFISVKPSCVCGGGGLRTCVFTITNMRVHDHEHAYSRSRTCVFTITNMRVHKQTISRRGAERGSERRDSFGNVRRAPKQHSYFPHSSSLMAHYLLFSRGLSPRAFKQVRFACKYFGFQIHCLCSFLAFRVRRAP